jgi:hypothetical protein
MHQFHREASLCYCDGQNNVTLLGRVKIVTDPEEKKRLWKAWMADYFPGGSEDPNYVLLEFQSERVRLWIDQQSADCGIEVIMSPSSCCGLMCSTCSWKASHGCGGCIETQGHPFHGECALAKCVLSRGYLHCGQCEERPCELLKDYSCGDSEHCDRPKGARIAMVQYWSKGREHE